MNDKTHFLFLLILFNISITTGVYAQKIARTDLIKEILNFQVSFYGQPQKTITQHEYDGVPFYLYHWGTTITEPEHPNYYYSVEVSIFPDSLSGSEIMKRYFEKEISDITDQKNELLAKEEFPDINGYLFENYIWKNREGNNFQTYIGIVENKYYKVSIYTRDDGLGGVEGLQFLSSFKLISLPAIGRAPFTPSYEIDFPNPSIHECLLMDDRLTTLSTEIYESITEADTLIDLVEYYQITEIKYPMKIEDTVSDINAYYNNIQNDILRKNDAILLQEENTTYDKQRGKTFFTQNKDNSIVVFKCFLIGSSLYLLEAKLTRKTEPLPQSVISFFDSFKLKA